MRKTVLSLIAALAVVSGLVVTSSAAYATDDNNDNGGSGAGISAGADVKVDPGVKVNAGVNVAADPTTTPVPPPCTVDHNPWVPGCQNSGPIYGGHHPGPIGGPFGHRWNDRWDGGNRYIVLDGGPRLDLCSFRDYNDLVGRYGVYRDRFGRLFGADPIRRFGDYRRSCGTNTVVVNDGTGCTTVTTYYNNYRNAVGRWNDLVRRYHTPQLFNQYRGQFDTIYRDRLRWQRLFDDNRRTVTTQCSAPVTLQPIVVQAPPVQYTAPVVVSPSADTTSEPAPAVEAPRSSSPAPVKVPNTSSGINAGDGSFALARG